MSSSPRSRLNEGVRQIREDLTPSAFGPSTTILSARRPSWSPSLPDAQERRRGRLSNSKSSSRRREVGNSDWAPSPPSTSLIAARRPSMPESRHRLHIRYPDADDMQVSDGIQSPADPPSSPEDGGNFRRSLQIDMKDLVGDAVGNMSISPGSRDVVLAARRGLFIIDLEAPLEVPRFLPQGGTWDVADVQWNPHHSRAEYIVSTSSEKLLIWNLLRVGKTSIEHILHSHYRAITDINWHTTECDTVVSTGIDSWLWAWDLREPRKPIFGLSAFNSGGTQVKWNRQDANILASSHSNDVMIWDRRKGSLPITKISAHNSKIYGIDWSHNVRNEIVTCSLDKTIKVWDINASTDSEGQHEPKRTIRTTYPVWRARHLPFGQGVLSLAQRGEAALEMYADDGSQTPVEIFEGHTDVVKEFVWRKGGYDGTEFQLITWSKDRTLRFWPVDADVMQKVGPTPEASRDQPQAPADDLPIISYRNPPDGTEYPPALSAPIGHRSILAEVRAPLPPRHSNLVLQPHQGSSARASFHESGLLTARYLEARHQATGTGSVVIAANLRTMSRGNFGGKSVGRMDPFTWLSNVKVGGRRGSSSGPGSGADSADVSRLSSRSRPPSGPDRQASELGERRRSESRSRGVDERREGEGNQSLQDEITSVLTKLAPSKIKLEKHDLTKKRTCTLGLHGPWGESSSVFIRVTFTFPRDYPQHQYPDGTPTVDLERNPLILMKDRAFMLRRLRAIRERRRPCLEACLRFLLFADEEEDAGEPAPIDTGSSSEDDEPSARKSRDFTVALLRNNKNLAEPRTSQGTFGPNGELVCFFRAPPRIVRNVLRGLSDSQAKAPEEPPQPTETPPRLFKSPALVSDAVRRLGLAAVDRIVKPVDPRRADDRDNILRIMTNLLTFSQHKLRRDSESKPLGEIPKSYALLPTRRSTVYITNTTNIAGGDRKVATEYIFAAESLGEVCERNAAVAREYGRYDHERAFSTLRTLFSTSERHERVDDGPPWTYFASNPLALQLIKQLYSDFSKDKDVQMLAMTSMLLLQACYKSDTLPSMRRSPSNARRFDDAPSITATPKPTGMDYFSLTKSTNGRTSPVSPAWPRLPSSPTAPPLAQSLSSSNSSRGSWSSLFNTGSVRQFMSGVQDSLKEGLITPSENYTFTDAPGGLTPMPKADRTNRAPDSLGPRRAGKRKDPKLQPSPTSFKFRDGPSASPTSAGRRRFPLSQVDNTNHASKQTATQGKRIVVFDAPPPADKPPHLLDSDVTDQFIRHIHVYAEMLFSWQLYHKRLELLKSVNTQVIPLEKEHTLGLIRTCLRCTTDLPEKVNMCPSCGSPCSMASCSVCRLPVKGLSRNCLRCFHVTHISCWNTLNVPICPTGCGCFCTGMEADHTQPPFPEQSHLLHVPSVVTSPFL